MGSNGVNEGHANSRLRLRIKTLKARREIIAMAEKKNFPIIDARTNSNLFMKSFFRWEIELWKKKEKMCDSKNEWFFYGIRRRSFRISLYDLNIVGSSITLIKSSKHKIIFVLIFRIKYRGKIYRNYFSLCQ